nr:RecName: Full=Bioactive peptide 3; Short=BAP3 [Latilactobacillus curvatus]
NIPQLTPTP